jgi:ribosomal protein S18 acetylase RimI-like enzyme
MLGVARAFWGQPPGPHEERYSARILRDLIWEARQQQDRRPILVLYVHVANTRGIAFYQRAGFAELHKPYTDARTGQVYKRMVLVVRSHAT